MGRNRPLIPLSFIAEGAKWLVCPDQGMAMVVPAPTYWQAKTARVGTFSISFHGEEGGCKEMHKGTTKKYTERDC